MMDGSELDAVRALLNEKPRPVGWAERRQRLDEVGSVWPVADDVELERVDIDGVPGEWSLVDGSDRARVLLFLRLTLGRRALANAGAFVRRHLHSP